MGAVAVGLVSAVLAPAPGDRFRLFDLYFDGREFCSLVRSVTIRLVFRPSASAPPVGAGFDLFYERALLCNVGFGHNDSF